MLIRSQDKEQLLNIDSVKTIGICERGKCFAILLIVCIYRQLF